jgi:hypothetical protein
VVKMLLARWVKESGTGCAPLFWQFYSGNWDFILAVRALPVMLAGAIAATPVSNTGSSSATARPTVLPKYPEPHLWEPLGGNKPRSTLLQFLLRGYSHVVGYVPCPPKLRRGRIARLSGPSPRLSSQSRIRQIRKKVKTRAYSTVPVPERWAIIQEGTVLS